MIRPVASIRLLMNGADTTAGSTFSLLSTSGRTAPTVAAQVVRARTVIPTTIAIDSGLRYLSTDAYR